MIYCGRVPLFFLIWQLFRCLGRNFCLFFGIFKTPKFFPENTWPSQSIKYNVEWFEILGTAFSYLHLLVTKICGWPKCPFSAISSQFFANCMDNCMDIYHKTEVQMVILRCWTGIYLLIGSKKYHTYAKKVLENG